MNPVSITRQNYWQVNGNNHSTAEEAFQDAVNQAMAAPGSIILVQPPGYAVVYTQSGGKTPPPPPTVKAAFTAAVDGLSVQITDQSSDVGSTIVSVRYDFGDGQSTPDMSPPGNIQHLYAAAGTYTVKQTVADASGNTDSTSHPITVAAQQQQPPPEDGRPPADQVTGTQLSTGAAPGGDIPEPA